MKSIKSNVQDRYVGDSNDSTMSSGSHRHSWKRDSWPRTATQLQQQSFCRWCGEPFSSVDSEKRTTVVPRTRCNRWRRPHVFPTPKYDTVYLVYRETSHELQNSHAQLPGRWVTDVAELAAIWTVSRPLQEVVYRAREGFVISEVNGVYICSCCMHTTTLDDELVQLY